MGSFEFRPALDLLAVGSKGVSGGAREEADAGAQLGHVEDPLGSVNAKRSQAEHRLSVIDIIGRDTDEIMPLSKDGVARWL